MEKEASDIGKQAQYLTDNHPATARLSHLVHRLQNLQPVLLRRSPPPP